MKISLIIPAYNEEDYIGMSLESVQKYGGGLHEVIVINNASTDKTAEVASKFSFVRVVDQPKKGLTAARQRGLEVATGDFLAYIDADTLITKDWFKTANEIFGKYPHIVALSGPRRYFGTAWYKIWLLNIMWAVAPIVYWLVGYMILGGNFIAKKEAIEAIGGFDESIQFYGEDTDIARRLDTVGKVLFKMNFYVYAAARRFDTEGIWRPNITYMLNYLWPVVFRKPFTHIYEDVR